MPGLSTIAQTGLPGYTIETFYGLFAPAKTTEAVIERLHREIVNVLTAPCVKEKFLNVGVEVMATEREQLTAAVVKEMATLGKKLKMPSFRGQAAGGSVT
jgi:tripartite-type tricarboxylate transporter receptor subunit TctC